MPGNWSQKQFVKVWPHTETFAFIRDCLSNESTQTHWNDSNKYISTRCLARFLSVAAQQSLIRPPWHTALSVSTQTPEVISLREKQNIRPWVSAPPCLLTTPARKVLNEGSNTLDPQRVPLLCKYVCVCVCALLYLWLSVHTVCVTCISEGLRVCSSLLKHALIVWEITLVTLGDLKYSPLVMDWSTN